MTNKKTLEHGACPVRGVKLFLPAADKIAEFAQCLDLLAHYRYTTLMIEVGGAMEYKRHPEINDTWVSYCREMNEYSGKAQKIQNAYGWTKNSIHSGNGGGGILSQEQVRKLLAYCRDRKFTVIPEVPLLSHCDYLVMAHPELRERAEDPYPDTYCPSHPDTYPLVFDLLEEVLGVFAPESVNIGHDEYYSIGLCPRCKGKDAAAIYADDVNKIHEWLRARGVRTMLWGEKLLNSHEKDGEPIGGAKKPHTPATYRAIDMIPNDIDILHWYWAIDRTFEEDYFKRNFNVIYGNFSGPIVPDWPKRAVRKGFKGVIISNWGVTDLVTLQRNGILFDVAYTSCLLADPSIDSSRFARLSAETFQALHLTRRNMLAAGNPSAWFIQAVHTTPMKKEYVEFVDGEYVDEEKYLMGHYQVRFDDGTESRLPVIYGQNISSRDQDWEQKTSDKYDCHTVNKSLLEVAFSTIPQLSDGKTWYHTEYLHTGPLKKIASWEFVPKPGCTEEVECQELRIAQDII